MAKFSQEFKGQSPARHCLLSESWDVRVPKSGHYAANSKPRYVLRPPQLRTKAAPLRLPH